MKRGAGEQFEAIQPGKKVKTQRDYPKADGVRAGPSSIGGRYQKPSSGKPYVPKDDERKPNSQKPSAQPDKKPRKDGSDEKRVFRFRKQIPKAVEQRLERVYQQRFYCVDRERGQDGMSETFKVLGSTGNVYSVTVSHAPSCTCPDHMKQKEICKHLLFVYLRVLQVDLSLGLHYQKGLVTSELETIFANAPANPHDATAERMSQIYRQATGKEQASSSAAPVGKKRVPQKGDDCPICYEEFTPGKEDGLVFCLSSCGQAVHVDCFRQWSRTAHPVTCVMCRQPWEQNEKAGKPGKATINEGYLNLADTAGISRVRDDSTYYHGPVRGSYSRSWHNPRNDRYNWEDGGRPWDSYAPGEHIPRHTNNPVPARRGRADFDLGRQFYY